MKLKTGDVLVRSRGPISDHFGIYLGEDTVAEDCHVHGVQVVSMEQYLSGKKLLGVTPFDGKESDRRKVRENIDKLIGKPYDLTRFNCIHFEAKSIPVPHTTTLPWKVSSTVGRKLRHVLRGQPQVVQALQALVAFIILRQ